jgi:MqsR (Motility quorum-sensing regulator) toxin of toxin-antitoxin system
MERWLWRVLPRVHELAEQGRIRFTNKALDELSDLGLDLIDASEILCALTTRECVERIRSEHTDKWLYTFRPKVCGCDLYVKLLIRRECVIVSFHEDVSAGDGSQED